LHVNRNNKTCENSKWVTGSTIQSELRCWQLGIFEWNFFYWDLIEQKNVIGRYSRGSDKESLHHWNFKNFSIVCSTILASLKEETTKQQIKHIFAYSSNIVIWKSYCIASSERIKIELWHMRTVMICLSHVHARPTPGNLFYRNSKSLFCAAQNWGL
jgi:hypothetical protein